MKHLLLIFTGSVFCCTGILIILYLHNENKTLPTYAFDRNYLARTIPANSVLSLGVNSYYLSGVSDDAVFLGNTTAPRLVVKADLSLRDTTHEFLKLPATAEVTAPGLRVNNHIFTLQDGSIPNIYEGTTDDWDAKPLFEDMPFFSLASPFNDGSYLLRILHQQESYELSRFLGDSIFEILPDLLQAQVDGLFDSDGMLVSNHAINEAFYVYFYRNEFLCIDSSGQLQYSGRTIDPIDKARIKVESSPDEKRKMLAAPPLIVNRFCSAYDEVLLIVSNIPGRTDTLNDAETLIDLYDTKNGRYRGSISLPHPVPGRLSSIYLYKNDLYVIIGDHLVKYSIPNIR